MTELIDDGCEVALLLTLIFSIAFWFCQWLDDEPPKFRTFLSLCAGIGLVYSFTHWPMLVLGTIIGIVVIGGLVARTKWVRGMCLRAQSKYYVRVSSDTQRVRAYYSVGSEMVTLFEFIPNDKSELPALRMTIEGELSRLGYIEMGIGLWRFND